MECVSESMAGRAAILQLLPFAASGFAPAVVRFVYTDISGTRYPRGPQDP